jgi:DNA polymerase III alpha subunit
VFVPLRVHSVYSKGEGGATLEELAWWAVDRGTGSLALTDVGNIYGWAKWKRSAAAAGVRPLFGAETETSDGRFLFLVSEREGYANLMEILNRREIGGPAALAGLVAIYLPPGAEKERENGAGGKTPDAGAALERLRAGPAGADLFVGADFLNFGSARELAAARGLPLIWANPLKFVRSPERLVLLRSFERKVPYPPEWQRLGRAVRRFGPEQEALALRKFGAEAAAAFRLTQAAAERCAFDFTRVLPPLPADLFPVSLREEVRTRLRARPDLGWPARERALRELLAVEKSGFAPYFLIVHDVVRFARREGILHNIKGSGASSYLLWLLGLSHVDPLAHDLYFERFLNAGRDDPPDIDLDFDSRYRDRILAYVLETYGAGRTGAAFVCSLKCFGARSALYETARAFGLPPEEARALSKRAPFFAEPSHLRTSPAPPGCLEIWNLAADLTGAYSETSLHVGGVILTPAPVERALPLQKSAKGFLMSHFDRDAVEDLKLIKLDLLSVRGLAAVSAVKAGLGLADPPADDPAALALLRSARTTGCFQVESPAMRNLLRRMKPAGLRDLVVALALIRPGPTESGMKEALLRDREGRGGGGDALLARLLPETGGILLYEEQVMQLAERVAGLPAEEGDHLRRALKRRDAGLVPLRERFARGAGERGYTGGQVEALWQVLEKFSSYSFNKAHSASYAAMAYQAAYLKAHHPVPYMAAVINAGGGYYERPVYIEEAKRMGIRILGPDVRKSGRGFEVEGPGIRVGLGAIKGLPQRTIDRLIEEREAGGDFGGLEDFLARVPLSQSELFTLVKAGVFDSLEARRTKQVLRYVQGIEGVEPLSDLDEREKAKMILDSLGFSPEADPLDLYEGRRPELRIKDLSGRAGQAVDLVVRVVDARGKEVRGGRKYFYLFEDETGTLEGVGGRKCLAQGDPPVCCLHGTVRVDGTGETKILDCSFLKFF